MNKKALIGTLSALSLLWVPISSMSIAQAATQKKVNVSMLNVRAGASANYHISAVLNKGNVVTVVQDLGSWDKISFSGGKTGYVSEKYLSSISSTAPAPTVKSTVQKKVNVSMLNVRTGPSANYHIATTLKKDNLVSVIQDLGAWNKISYANGKTGYVSEKYLSSVSSPAPAPKPTVPVTNVSTYTVTSGDTLWSISSKFKITVDTLKQLNGLKSNTIHTGQKLKVNGTVSNSPVSPTPIKGTLSGKTIVIDPGHGGRFAGAHGIVAEEDINLQIASKLRDKLQTLGAKVIMTRTSDIALSSSYDIDLASRPAIAIKNHANLFISIHANSGSSSASGSETLYYNSKRDLKLAQSVISHLVSKTGMKSRGAKYQDVSVLRNSGSSIPSTLVETGFVTNSHDASIIGSSSGQSNVAQGISEGIVDFFY